MTTFHNDAARTGQNTEETILTPANVNSTQFGKLFSVSVDGVVYAQPLYLSGVNIAGGTHNVLYVATEHDSVYAIDANSGSIYSQVSLIPAGGSTVNSSTDLGCSDLVPEVGITGTPVIDPATGTLYVIAASNVGGKFYQYLHALDVATLSEKFGGPVAIQASVPGSGSDSSGGQVVFNPLQENQRTALLLENGHVVAGWAAHCDHSPWHGWIISYNAATLAQEGAFNTSPNLGESGVWISGGGIAADTSGNLYFPTGNGGWNGTTDFGDSIVKLGPPANGSFPVLDYFTPYDQGSLDSGDTDVSSGGIVLLPPLASGTQLLAQQGKQGTIYLLNAGNLGKYCPNLTPACTTSDTNVVEEIAGASPGIWGSPAYWNGNLYWAGANDSIKAYSFNAGNSGLISTSPTSQSTEIFAYTSPTPTISSNGDTDGILWALDGAAYDSTCDGGSSNCLGLFAYDATNLANLLYSSSQAPNNRDSAGVAVKFQVPIVANGMVYVGTQSSVIAYGLLSNVAATPTFNPAPGAYSGPQQVTLSDGTAGAAIYYTTNGTAPTASSTKYAAGTPLSVGATETIQAIAVASGYADSAVASGTYTISASGTTSTSVSLASNDDVIGIGSGGTAVSGGGLDGSGNVYASNLLGTSITWSDSTFTLGSAGVVDAVSDATVALPAGSYASVALLATGVNGNQADQKFVVTYTDGTTTTITQSLSDWATPQSYPGESIVATTAYRVTSTGATANGPFYLYGYTFTIDSAKTVASITLPANRNVVVLAIDVQGSSPPPVTATPTFSPAPGTYTGAQQVTLADGTSGAALYYTTNGTTPTTSSAKYTAGTPISVGATETIEAIAVASGYTESAVASGTYTISTSGTAASTAVSLASQADVVGIGAVGTAVSGGGLDGSGNVYASNLLGTSITWSDSTFTLGSAGVVDAVSDATVALPAGSYSSVALLATGVNGNQANQKFVVTYTDGTTTTITQSLSDWFTPQNYAGESIAATTAYRVISSGATANGPFYLYAYTFSLDNAKTVASITLPATPNVVVLAIDLVGGPSAAGTMSVPLASKDDVVAIGTVGAAVIDGGLDGGGYAYAANLLGSSITWSGSTFSLGSAGAVDAVSNATVPLPAGSYSSMALLATAVNGNQSGQQFVVTYTDGTSSTFTQSLSDWFTPQSYAGESIVATMAYRVTPTGGTVNGPFNLYGYSFALNGTKTVASLTLPVNRDVVVLAVDLLN